MTPVSANAAPASYLCRGRFSPAFLGYPSCTPRRPTDRCKKPDSFRSYDIGSQSWKSCWPSAPRGISRFADWYVGEIFVDPKAAIPNARRGGFEENRAWEGIRNELDAKIATPLGKQAYKTYKADQLLLENLQRRPSQVSRRQLRFLRSRTVRRLRPWSRSWQTRRPCGLASLRRSE